MALLQAMSFHQSRSVKEHENADGRENQLVKADLLNHSSCRRLGYQLVQPLVENMMRWTTQCAHNEHLSCSMGFTLVFFSRTLISTNSTYQLVSNRICPQTAPVAGPCSPFSHGVHTPGQPSHLPPSRDQHSMYWSAGGTSRRVSGSCWDSPVGRQCWPLSWSWLSLLHCGWTAAVGTIAFWCCVFH